MELKDAIMSVNVGSAVSTKTNKPYTFADILFKASDGTVVRKRVFFVDFEKALLNITI